MGGGENCPGTGGGGIKFGCGPKGGWLDGTGGTGSRCRSVGDFGPGEGWNCARRIAAKSKARRLAIARR